MFKLRLWPTWAGGVGSVLLTLPQAVGFCPCHAGSDPFPGPVPAVLLTPQLLWELEKPGLEADPALCWLNAFGSTEAESLALWLTSFFSCLLDASGTNPEVLCLLRTHMFLFQQKGRGMFVQRWGFQGAIGALF